MTRINLRFMSAALLLTLAACSEGISFESSSAIRQVPESGNESIVAEQRPELQVYKSPTCGCCTSWALHLNGAGFATKLYNTENMQAIKEQFGVSPQYQSCHTAVGDGYVFEGHVPASVIDRFLAEKPEGAIGLAVAGMPIGSPGMEMGERFTPYDVMLLKQGGGAEVYQHIAKP